MRGGKSHVFAELAEPIVTTHGKPPNTWTQTIKYFCSVCGEMYQKRSTAPSCAIDHILIIDQYAQEFLYDDAHFERYGDTFFDRFLMQKLRWPKYERERFIGCWRRWRQFITDPPALKPTA